MNAFELYTMIFYVVDLFYDDNPSAELGAYLGAMSPLTFDNVGSADPAIFEEFKKYINGRKITLENSFGIAKEYVKTISYCNIQVAFDNFDEERWIKGCRKYLSEPHKGADSSAVD